MGRVVRNRQGLEQLRVAVQGLGNTTGKVGWFETAKYPDGTPVAYVASIHEFGYAAGSIPPRPSMRPTIAAQSKEWALSFGKGATAAAKGNYTAAQVMDAVGLMAAGDVAKTISKITQPPLKPATVAARRRRYADQNTTGNLTKPLVDTALMVTSITHLTESKT